MNEQHQIEWSEIGNRLRAWRDGQAPRVSLQKMADLLAEKGPDRPSIATLSRIESGIHPASTAIVAALEEITGIPAADIRPDLASLFRREGAA